MLWAMVLALVILWLLGLVSGYTVDDFIHILLFFAIIAMLIQIEDDCNNHGFGQTRKRHLKRQSIARSRKILPKLAILSREKIP